MSETKPGIRNPWKLATVAMLLVIVQCLPLLVLKDKDIPSVLFTLLPAFIWLDVLAGAWGCR